jgi:Plasmid pRiA4b ORF-3-like protein
VKVCLGDFQLRPTERFRYRYNFLAFWESVLRLEATVPRHEDLTYPRCVGGRHPAPDEDYGGAWEYQRMQEHYEFPPLEALSVLAITTAASYPSSWRP